MKKTQKNRCPRVIALLLSAILLAFQVVVPLQVCAAEDSSVVANAIEIEPTSSETVSDGNPPTTDNSDVNAISGSDKVSTTDGSNVNTVFDADKGTTDDSSNDNAVSGSDEVATTYSSDAKTISDNDDDTLTSEQTGKIDQPTTSENVSVNYDITLEDGIFKIFYNIEEEAEGDIVIDFTEVIDMLNKWYQDYTGKENAVYPMVPSDYNKIDIEVSTSNGHTYKYKDGSFRLETSDTSSKDNLTDFVGFDGQKIPLSYIGALAKSEPIQKLFGVNRSGKVTIDMVTNIYGYLEEKGFTGETALTDYLLSYYNEELGSDYKSFTELYDEHPEKIMKMQGGLADHQYVVDEAKLNSLQESFPESFEQFLIVIPKDDGKYLVQFKWPEEQLATASYMMFYDHLLNFAFGSKETQENFEAMYDKWHDKDLGVKDYMDDTNGVWSDVNEYLKQATAAGLSKDEATKLAISMAFGLDGPWTDNSYQHYSFSWYNSIELEQVDGDITINKIDENGNMITSPATFNLYYYSVEVVEGQDQKVTYFYAIDDDGNSYFTKDSSKAAAIITENGTCTVKYLLPNYEYYLKEIVAPEGFELNPNEISIKVASKQNTIIEIKNTKISKPKPNPDPDPDPDPKPGTNPNPKPEEKPEPTTTPETPSPDTNPSIPKTGDTSNIANYAIVCVLSFMGIIGLLVFRNKRKIKF